MKKINFRWIVILLLLFLSFPMTVYGAGWMDGGNSSDGGSADKNIITDEAQEPTIKQRLQEYCSFWSFGYDWGDAYSNLNDYDENSVNGYAVMVDTETGGRGSVRDSGCEDIMEFQGYYYYDIKLTTSSEDNTGAVGYTRRTYYKYVELKKEDRTFNGGSSYVFSGASTGIWLYYSSDTTSDSLQQTQTELNLIDVFTGNSLADETTPYWERMK